MVNRFRRDAAPYCSFCGKAPEQARPLVAGRTYSFAMDVSGSALHTFRFDQD
jgi:hypothetical protein